MHILSLRRAFYPLVLLLAICAHAQNYPLITEFMASNNSTLADEDGEYSDWIEIWNPGASPVNLNGWFLSDDPGNLPKWRFPATNLAPNAYMVVFASGKDRAVPGLPLHTSFNLSANGEYLALLDPNTNIISAYTPNFPRQARDVSFGIVTTSDPIFLITEDASVRVHVPTDTALGSNWLAADYNDTSWSRGTNGVGYETGSINAGEDSSTIVPYDAAWKYLLRTSDIGTTAWRGAGYDDSGWANGVGAFTFPATDPLPVGVNRGTTLPLSSGSMYSGVYMQTVYFRTTFNFSGSTENVILTFSNVVDDGAVFYINGQEIGQRINLPASPTVITWNTGASVATEGVFTVFEAAPTNLVQGVNVLAVELHNASGSSSDLVFGMSLSVRYGPEGPNPPSSDHYSFADQIRTDVRNSMFAQNSSCYLRYAFDVTDPAQMESLALQLKYDDGFAAYLNGVFVAARNAPPEAALNMLPWNATATTYHPDLAAVADETIDISAYKSYLRAGQNILAIHALNTSPTNSDFLLTATLETHTQVAAHTERWRYFVQPTPGAANGAGSSTLGAVISEMQFGPLDPQSSDPINVTARIRATFDAVTNVTLFYRVMFSNEVSLKMFDDGAHSDGAANDGIYGARIPSGIAGAGQMVRWYITANDAQGTISRLPLFSPGMESAQYFGTVMALPPSSSQVPVFHVFIQNTNWYVVGNCYSKQTNTSASVYWLGRFYDNVSTRIRGASSVVHKFPKQSMQFEFNPGDRFLAWPDRLPVKQVDLNMFWTDKAYIRNYLSLMEVYRAAGVPSSEISFVQRYLNGAWSSTDSLVEEPDEVFLEQNGLDPNGAYYKMFNALQEASVHGEVPPCANPDGYGGADKKTRRWEDHSDLQVLVNSIKSTNPNRLTYLFDNLNVPEVINYFAASLIIQDWDRYPKNHFMYRDTLGTREWKIIPWDGDLSWGYAGWFTDDITATHATFSHPLYGQSDYVGPYGQWHALADALYRTPVFREMFLRRARTLLDQIMQHPSTPAAQLKLETRINELQALLTADVDRDKQRWGNPFGTAQTFAQALSLLKNNYLAPHRTHLFVTHGPPNGLIPAAQFAYPVVQFGAIEFNPASGNQAEEYLVITNINPFAVDVSGWKVEGGIRFTFEPGTVIPSNSVIYLTPDLVSFRARTTGPRGGQGLFAVGNYQGQLSARGESLQLYDPSNRLVRTTSYAGAPSLAQDFLRVSEIMYHPSPLTGNTNVADAFEFIELRNISTSVTLDLNGVRFTNGIYFSFTGSAVTSLGPGQAVLVVKNAAAFAARYGSSYPVAGEYLGQLSNGGERIQLVDARGEEILDFTYDNKWYPITDGLSFSLVAVDLLTEPDSWNQKSNWRVGGVLNGSPGVIEPPFPAIVPVVINEVLSRSDTNVVPGIRDAIELYNPTSTNADLGGWYLTDNFDLPKKFRIPAGTILRGGSYITFDESQFNPVPGISPSFALSSAGEQVWLFSAASTGDLTGYCHGYEFGAADLLVTFGRGITSDSREHFVAQIARTLGTNNAGPYVGPVAITEIMYNPAGLAVSTNENVELRNVASSPVPLFDPQARTNTWKITGGIDYIFPTNITLSAGEYILLVNFDPTNTALLSAFRSSYGLSTGVRIFGPMNGKLNNAGDDIKLKKPAVLDLTNIVEILADQVEFQPSLPWPGGADGFGFSLQRKYLQGFGQEPTNWVAALPTPAAATVAIGTPPSLTTQPMSQSVLAYSPVTLSVAATGAPLLRYQWRWNGLLLQDATNASLSFLSVQPEQAGNYQVVVFNTAGSVVSSNALLMVGIGPVITLHPASVMARQGSNVTLTVSAFSGSGSGLAYQWYLDGLILPGLTNTSISLPNIQATNSGTYTVLVSDDAGTVTSAPALVTVVFAPGIAVQPVAQTTTVGGEATFSIMLTNGTLPINYQWRFGTTPITNILLNSHSSFFTLRNVQLSQAGNYRVVMTNVAVPNGYASSTAPLYVLADADGDRIPDAWTQSYFGHATGQAGDLSRAVDDADGDAMTNWQEYVAGTNPRDALSYLKVDSLMLGNPRTIQFMAVSNRTYSVQWTDRLGIEPWQTVADVVSRTNSRVETVTDSLGSTNGYYRLVTPRQP